VFLWFTVYIISYDEYGNFTYFLPVMIKGTGVIGSMRGSATLRECNQKPSVVKDTIGRPHPS